MTNHTDAILPTVQKIRSEYFPARSVYFDAQYNKPKSTLNIKHFRLKIGGAINSHTGICVMYTGLMYDVQNNSLYVDFTYKFMLPDQRKNYSKKEGITQCLQLFTVGSFVRHYVRPENTGENILQWLSRFQESMAKDATFKRTIFHSIREILFVECIKRIQNDGFETAALLYAAARRTNSSRDFCVI